MKNILLLILLIPLILACNSKLNRKDVIEEYYSLHKYIYKSSIDEINFPIKFEDILSKKYLQKEKEWFNSIQNFITQLINQKRFFLGNIQMKNITEYNKFVIVNVTTIRPEYQYRKKIDLENLIKKYNCKYEEIEIITKIDKKLTEMLETGYIIGKGWYPTFKTIEEHKFYFDRNNKIDNVEFKIISGKLTDSYDDVIDGFIEYNKEINN